MTKGSTGSFPYKTSKKPLAQGSSSLASLSTAETQMWELAIKKAEYWKTCFWTVVLEKTLESPLDCKEIKPVNPKGNRSWILIGKTDAEAPILWPPDVKNWFTGKDPNAGKDWRQEENGMTEDEMVGWNHQLNGHEFEQAPGVGDGQGNLACCSLLVTQSWMTLQSHGLQPIRLLCPWDFPGKDTGVGCHFLLQGIFPTQGSNPGLLHCRQILYWLSYKGSPCCSLCGHKELDTTEWLNWFFFF